MRILLTIVALIVALPAHSAKKSKEQTALSRPKTVRGVLPQVKQQINAYWSECNQNGGESCMLLGAAYEKGEVLPRSQRFAADLYAKVCDERQNGGACYKAGMRHYKGLDGQESKTTAAEYFKKSCELEQISGCTNRAMMLIKGEGVPADPQAATAIFQDACERTHAQACVEWGLALEKGKAGAPDIDKALRVYGSGCDQGALDGCYRHEAPSHSHHWRAGVH